MHSWRCFTLCLLLFVIQHTFGWCQRFYLLWTMNWSRRNLFWLGYLQLNLANCRLNSVKFPVAYRSLGTWRCVVKLAGLFLYHFSFKTKRDSVLNEFWLGELESRPASTMAIYAAADASSLALIVRRVKLRLHGKVMGVMLLPDTRS